MLYIRGLLLCLALLSGDFAVAADQAQTVRVGVLKFGTVNWELDTVLKQELDKKSGVKIKVVPLASKSATQVAVQGGAVDVIVTDWLWVSRQRASGRDYTFVPYSTAAGSLMVDPASGISALGDLRGKKVGVAGGPLDKSWLLLQAYYAKEQSGADIAKTSKPTFAAPPLLNQLILRKELPAVLNFWHFSARLKAAGMKPLFKVSDILPALGVDRPVPLIGWVFREEWAKSNEQGVKGFLEASMAAKTLLKTSDDEWQRLRPLMKVKTDAEWVELREAYRDGIPVCFGQADLDAANKMFTVLAELGGEELVGKQQSLSEGTFWRKMPLDPCPR